MKIPQKPKEKKDKVKKKDIAKKSNANNKKVQIHVVTQEIKFARLLSGNEKKSRDKVLKTLKKWLLNCFEKNYEFKEDDFVRVWKGLFYAVWMSDKPLIQEELCESISGVLDLFPPEQLKYALLMFKAGLRVLATEWYGVDHHRMDKFLMLVRRYLRASLRCLLRSKWSLTSCQMYAKTISGTDGIFSLKTPRYARNATSMLLHVIDCYLEEIAKVSEGDIPPTSLAELLRPFCAYTCAGEHVPVCGAARRLLTALLRQSELGIQYQHATRAWEQMGCPEGGPEALELVMSDDDDDDDEQNDDDMDEEPDSSAKPLDPRAGRVNVELPLLPVPASALANMLRDMLANTSCKAHKRARICLQRFEQLARDEYPLKVKPPIEDDSELEPAPKPKQLAHSLHVLEKKLVTASDELALRGLSRKHRKRLLAKSRAGQSIVDDVEHLRLDANNATNGAWKVEESEPASKKSKQDTATDKENKNRKRDKKDAELKENGKTKINGEVTNKLTKVDKKLRNNKNKIDNKNSIVKTVKEVKTKVIPVSKDKVNNKSNVKTMENKTPVKNSKKDVKTPEKLQLNNKPKLLETPKQKDKKSPIEKSSKKAQSPTLLVNKVKKFQKSTSNAEVSPNKSFSTPKKVKFVLKNNSMQAPVDYYKSIRQSPNIPFDSSKKPTKTNLKPSTPSPINPFFKKKSKLRH